MSARKLLIGLAVAVASVAAAPASAGVIAFNSTRCQDDADHDSRRNPMIPSQCINAVWTVGDDGANLTRLTDGFDESRPYGYMPYGDAAPSWSPDGARIAFTRDVPPAVFFRLWTYENGTARPFPITPGTGFYSDETPAFSPDGRAIVFASTRGSEQHEHIFIVPASGGDPTQLTSGSPKDREPTWSPDGQRIVFERQDHGPPRIYSMRADGTDQAPVTRGDLGPEIRPSYSPDGGSILFMGLTTLYAAAVDGSDVRPVVTDRRILDARWIGPTTIIGSASTPEDAQVIVRAELTAAGATVTPITTPIVGPAPPQGQPNSLRASRDIAPDWIGSAGSATPAPSDREPPVVLVVDPQTASVAGTVDPASARLRAARPATPRMARERAVLYAIDSAGVGRVEFAIARVTRTGTCRFAVGTKLRDAAACAKAPWKTFTSNKDWTSRAKRLRAGTYRVFVRSRDRAGNRSPVRQADVRFTASAP